MLRLNHLLLHIEDFLKHCSMVNPTIQIFINLIRLRLTLLFSPVHVSCYHTSEVNSQIKNSYFDKQFVKIKLIAVSKLAASRVAMSELLKRAILKHHCYSQQP